MFVGTVVSVPLSCFHKGAVSRLIIFVLRTPCGPTPPRAQRVAGDLQPMLLKAGVSIRRLNRTTRRTLPFLERLFASVGQELTITSTFEGNHGAGSLHYCDDAVDYRRPKIVDINGFVHEIKRGIGPDFDVVLKPDHIHQEYDPKG